MRQTRFITLLILAVLAAGCAARRTGPEMENGMVRFSLRAPQARTVTIAGSFNRWDAAAAALAGPDRKGVWSIALPLPGGRYEYLFVVDGATWVNDPAAQAVDDGFGGKNSVVTVPGEGP